MLQVSLHYTGVQPFHVQRRGQQNIELEIRYNRVRTLKLESL